MLAFAVVAQFGLRPGIQPGHVGDPPPFSLPSEDQRYLSQVGIQTDAPALITFFQRAGAFRARSEDLRTLVKLLGDSSFDVREKATQDLLLAGDNALPLLRQACMNPDPETARRAKQVCDAMERWHGQRPEESAARLLASSTPPNPAAIRTFLEFLPHAEPSTEEIILDALTTLVSRQKQFDASILRALTDPSPRPRAAGARLLGHAKKDTDLLRPLLADATPEVRLEAAVGLLRSGDRAAHPVLLALLREAPLPLAWRAEGVLERLAAGHGPCIPLHPDPASRGPCVAAWEAWWRESGLQRLGKPIDLDDPLRGAILVTDLDWGQLIC
jgi:hypothetical protein